MQQKPDDLFSLVEKDDILGLKAFLHSNKDTFIDQKNDGRKTILMIAASKGNNEIMEFLLNEMGANPNVDDGESLYRTALHYAAEDNHAQCVTTLVKNERIGKESVNRALIYYAKNGDEDKVKVCLHEKEADINAKHWGNTALMEAITHGHENIALLLLSYPSLDINLTNAMNEHALLLALIFNRRKVVDVLLQKDINLHLQGYLSSTALTYAVFNGNEAWTRVLADKEIKKYQKLEGRLHPEALNWAIKQNNYPLVELFLKFGTDPNEPGDVQGINRPDWVWKSYYDFEVDYPIEQEGQRNELPLICAVKAENEEILRLLISYGADPKKTNQFGENALAVALEESNEKLHRILLEASKKNEPVKILEDITFGGDAMHDKIWERLRQDSQRRLETDQRLSQEGNAHAIYEMARRYHNGWGIPADLQQSLQLYDKAAHLGHAGACVEIARLHLFGNEFIGIGPNLDLAEMYSRMGSEANKELYHSSTYHQKEFVEQATGLLKIAEYQRSNCRFVR